MKVMHSLPMLFVSLCLSSLAGAQAGVTLLVKTDMSCKWKLDGQPMDPLKADDSKVVLVSPGEHLIEASTPDRVASTRIKVTVDNVEKTVSIQLKGQCGKQSEMQHDDAARIRAGEALTPTWTDPATELTWTRKDNGSDVDWPKANAYCSDLKLAGDSDWRLPTLEELQEIYDPSVNTPRVFGGDGLTYGVHVKGNLNLTGWTWSSLQGDNPGKPYQVAWLFKFSPAPLSRIGMQPQYNFLHFTYNMRALCVRRAENNVIAP